MTQRRFFITITVILLLAVQIISCQIAPNASTPSPTDTPPATTTPAPTPVLIGPSTPSADEPVLITGEIPYTSPFFVYSLKDSFVMLEDQTGFIRRDREFEFPLEGQTIGPVIQVEDGLLTYRLLLPSIPQAAFADVDNDDQEETGVQIFAAAYWSNTWGDPFLERRDGTGWSNAYASTTTDPNRDEEINGGVLIVWAPDDEQDFPTGFGEDGELFTADDPIGPIPAGYNVVDLDQEPFAVYKEAQPQIDLHEGEAALNDYSDMSYEEAFEALFDKMSRDYPFTEEKGLDWPDLHDEFAPRIAKARNETDFYRAIRDFTWAIPDGHVGVQIDANVFFEEHGGSFGMIPAELSDGRVIVADVLPGLPAAEAGIEVGAEIVEWDGEPVGQVIGKVQPFFGPYSTEHRRRLEQVVFLTRVLPLESVTLTFQNPGAGAPQEITLESLIEIDSLFQALPYLSEDELTLPVQGEVLDGSGIGYINIATFAADYNLMADLWKHYIDAMIENEVPGLILDLRLNGGGNSGLAMDFAGYFFDEEIILSRDYSYNELTGAWEAEDIPRRLLPGPAFYDGPIAVLVSPFCVSACEGFSDAMARNGRAIIVGHYPSAGAFGGVGRGQVKLPDDLSMQFPASRSETLDGELLIEGVGVVPDVTVPVTEESALGLEDTVLDAAIEALLKEIGR